MSGTLRLRGATSGYSELQAPAVAGDQTFVLPTTGGTLLTIDTPVEKLLLELGSASAPSLTFEGDTDTGLYSSGTNTLNLVTGGSDRLVIDSSGNVGIGTTNPSYDLHVNGRIAAADGTDSSPSLTFASGGGNGLYYAGSGNIGLSTGGSEKLRIDSSGNVGIGTTSPTALLDLEGTSPIIKLTDSDATGTPECQISGAGGDLILEADRDNEKSNSLITFAIDGSERMRINSSGNVGIGTTSPADKLTVGDTADAFTSISIESTNTGIGELRFADSDSANPAYVKYEHTGNNLIFAVNAAERMRINSSGYLGVGTSNPIYKIDVDNTTDLYTVIRASNTSGISNSASILQLLTSDTGGSNIRYVNHSVSHTAQFYQLVGSSIPTFFCDFDTQIFRANNGTEHMRITSSGSVGINTNSPTQKVDVEGNVLARDGTNVKGALLSNDGCLEVYRDTSNAFIDFKTSIAEDYDCRIQQEGDGLRFDTGGNGSSTERMRITGTGNVLIRRTANTDGGVLTVDQDASTNNVGISTITTSTGTRYHLLFRNGNGQVGSIATNGTSTAFNTSSDYRLKENVVDLDGAIDRVKQLAPKRFNFIADADTTVDGFLAHEAQTVVPEAVTGTHDEVNENGDAVMQGIDQSKLVPLLTAALQEAIVKIETLEANNLSLENRIAALENN